MKMATYVGFMNELQKLKEAGLAEHALEVGGLGLLAAPTAYKAITGKKAGEKKSLAAELGGLGILAAHPAYELGKHFLKKGSANIFLDQKIMKRVKKLSPHDQRMFDEGMKFIINDEYEKGRIVGAKKGEKSPFLKKGSVELNIVNAALSLFTKKAESDLWEPTTGRVIGGAMGSRAANRGIAGAAAAAKPKFTLDHLRTAYAKSGLKPAITSVLKKASVTKAAMGVRPGLGSIGAGILNAGAKAAKGVAKPMAKMVASPQRAAMMQHFTPPSSVNMSRAISL